MERRRFLLSAAGSAFAPARVMGANDKVNVAIVGFGGRGRDLLNAFSAQPRCQVAAMCDIDQSRLEQGAQLARKAGSANPKSFQDIRRVLDDKDIDAVAIATCNHWHALATIWACQAGKDVYVEKPASHNVWEGRRMVEAARKYGRAVQVGMQGRSITHKRQAIELLREGVIGPVYMAKGLCYKRRLSIGRKPSAPVPPGVDYNLWLGPAAWRDFNPNRFHYNWHWFWDTGNGDIGNQGPHQMDLARWGLGLSGLPRKVFSSGAKFIYDDDQETPNTQLASFDFGDRKIVFEVRGLLTAGEDGIPIDGGNFIGNLFFGAAGVMAVDASGYRVFAGEKRELVREMKRVEALPDDPAPHAANFLSVMRSRKFEQLAAGIEEGHISSSMCHLANISYRVGRSLEFDPAREKFSAVDTNALLSRKYRAPFAVPERV